MKIRLAEENQKSGILIHYAGLRTYEINDDKSAFEQTTQKGSAKITSYNR